MILIGREGQSCADAAGDVTDKASKAPAAMAMAENDRAHQSTFTPVVLTTSAHFGTSCAMMAANSCGS